MELKCASIVNLLAEDHKYKVKICLTSSSAQVEYCTSI